jgi:formylglycine-generating enzyme required for sulfatase activity
VEPGPFWSNSPHSVGARHAAPLQQYAFDYGYKIARFPVTNAEYQRFIEAGGYQQSRWWTLIGWAFLQSGGHPLPRDGKAAAITHPNLCDHPSFNAPAQPVVGVSWYEASAYCAWLTEQGHRAGWLPDSAIIRLPTSLEWERAARHIDQRRYPWGDDAPDSRHANYNDTGLHTPAPIGCFPQGAAACGALDMAGNVWEWTASLWEEIGHPAPRAEFHPHEKPAIRGGAFNWSADYLHCGAHYWFSPGYRQNLLGFRVVLVGALKR